MPMVCIKCKHLTSKGKNSICEYCFCKNGKRFNYFEEKYPVTIIDVNNKDDKNYNINIQDRLFNKW